MSKKKSKKPEALTIREYYFGPETQKKVKKALFNAMAFCIRTVDTALEPIVYWLIEVREACHNLYLRTTGRWYCQYCNKLHSRRVIKYHNDDYGTVCSLCPPTTRPTAYEDCIEACKALDTEAKRFDRLMQVVQNAAASTPTISVETNNTSDTEHSVLEAR